MTHWRTWEPLLAASSLVRGPALIVAPHPDDEIVGCGGVLIAHREEQAAVHVAVMTDGARGNPTGMGGADYTALRREETRRAAEIVGGFEPHFLDHPDGSLKESEAASDDLLRLLDRLDPATLFAPSPFEVHPDHRAACLHAFKALQRSDANPEILLYEVGAMMPVNLLVDVTPYMLAKEQAIEVYFSQLMHQDILGKVRALNRSRTVNVDDVNVRYAEAYLRVEADRATEMLDAVDRLLAITDTMGPELPAS